MMEYELTESQLWANFARTNVRPHDPRQRELFAKWLSRRGTFKTAGMDPIGSTPEQATDRTYHRDTPRSAGEVFALLHGHWKAGDVVGVARLHNVPDSLDQVTQPGTFSWDRLKGLPHTVDHWGASVAEIVGVYDVPKDGLPIWMQGKFPTCTGGVLVARRYSLTDAGHAAKAAVESGSLGGMSLTYSGTVDDARYDRQHLRTLKMITHATISEFCDTASPKQYFTQACLTERDYLGGRGFVWDL